MYIFKTSNPEVNFDFSNATSFEVFNSQALSSTTTTYPTYATKLSGTTSESETGDFVFNWYAELTNSANNAITWFIVDYKRSTDVTWETLTEIDVLVPRGESFVPVSGFKVVTIMNADTLDFRIRYAREGSSTARIKNTNLYVFRVSQ